MNNGLFDAFRVDPSETFAHNFGAKMLRTALVCLVIALAGLTVKLLHVGSSITLVDKAQIVITELEQTKHTHYRRRRHGGRRRVTTYTYHVSFTGELPDGTHIEGRQKSDYDQFCSFRGFDNGEPHELYVYKSGENGSLFISRRTHDGALREFRKSNPSMPETIGWLVFRVAGLISIPLFSSGMQHNRAGKRAALDRNAAANQRLNDAARIFDRK